ncbi:hypothetical protein DFH11DRAFT_281578 [Phellopilus nigrolimitatus]|nr:hypothetical protein DFH11DRAFT_281578 [Phellopilus nigrolimitatus]
MPSYQRLQRYAIAISIVSIFYCSAEGAVSIALGSESSSRSLIFFGIQSGIEVASAAIVLWRFRRIAKPGEEGTVELSDRNIRIERIGTWSIGVLIAILALATEITAVVGLAQHNEPDVSNASLIVSASALVLMVLLWLPKRFLARALDSSTMAGEATCSLSCIQITIVLFIGALVFRLWRGGWWVDSATSLVLGLLFAREAWKMLAWVRHPEFNGGCCGGCAPPRLADDKAELGEQYRDLCECCMEKEECKNSDTCKCETSTEESEPCCVPINPNGAMCCSREVVKGVRPQADQPGCQDRSCADTACAVDKPVVTTESSSQEASCEQACCGGDISAHGTRKQDACCESH